MSAYSGFDSYRSRPVVETKAVRVADLVQVPGLAAAMVLADRAAQVRVELAGPVALVAMEQAPVVMIKAVPQVVTARARSCSRLAKAARTMARAGMLARRALVMTAKARRRKPRR